MFEFGYEKKFKSSKYLQKSRPILNQKVVDNRYDVVLVDAVLFVPAVYSQYKYLFRFRKKRKKTMSRDF